MWSVKYKPKSLDEFLGNCAVVSEIVSWARNWKKGKSKALMIIGPCGCGKTTLCEIIAKELSLNLIETNSSDVRKKAALLQFFGSALSQQSLFFSGKLVLFDEVDGLAGNYDRGATSALKDIILKSSYPVILTATDKTVRGVKDMRKICKVVNFEPLDISDVIKGLRRICSLVGIEYDDLALKRVARSAGGDMRAAINNLQGVVSEDGHVTEDMSKDIDIRDTSMQINEILTVIFNTLDPRIAEGVMQNTDTGPDEILEWVRENVARVYKNEKDVARAFNMISRADVFRGRISIQQYWRFLVYQSKLMSIGVAVSKENRYRGIVVPVFPQKIGVLARTMFSRQKDKKNALALGQCLHCSRRVTRGYFPLIEIIRSKRASDYKVLCDSVGVEF